MEMNNQNQNQQTQTPDQAQTETNTPEQILAEMKENMVPKEEAVKWQQKYNELFRNVANGTFTKEDKPLSEEDKRKAFEENVREMTGESSVKPLDFFKNLVDFDDYLIEHGERSCFAPSSGTIDAAIENSCQQVHDLLTTVIDESQGNNEIALAVLGNYLNDPSWVSIKSRR